MFEFEEKQGREVRIKVIGVGGGGGNALNTMIVGGLNGVEFIAANTDAQALKNNKATLHVQLGRDTTRGLGAGANPEVGRAAAEEDVERIREVVNETDMVFVTCGMGGGTGTGAAPIVARVARESGCLTVGVVTKPFFFEGPRRMRQADSGIAELRDQVDALITIPNMKLLKLAGKDMQMTEAFGKADEVLYQAVKAISDIITVNGLINVDFADVRTIMAGMGRALMGTGVSTGENRAKQAAERAVHSPLLEDISIQGAQGVLINVTGSSSLKLSEVEEAASLIQASADPEANIIFGSVIDDSMGEEIRVTVIATGFDQRQDDVLASSQRRPERLTLATPAAHLRGEISDPSLSSRSINGESVSTFTFNSTPAPQPARRAASAVAPAIERRDEDLDIPTVLRQEQGSLSFDASASTSTRRLARSVLGGGLAAESELDVPAFLRRGRD